MLFFLCRTKNTQRIKYQGKTLYSDENYSYVTALLISWRHLPCQECPRQREQKSCTCKGIEFCEPFECFIFQNIKGMYIWELLATHASVLVFQFKYWTTPKEHAMRDEKRHALVTRNQQSYVFTFVAKFHNKKNYYEKKREISNFSHGFREKINQPDRWLIPNKSIWSMTWNFLEWHKISADMILIVPYYGVRICPLSVVGIFLLE